MIIRLHAPGVVDEPVNVVVPNGHVTVTPDGPARIVAGPGRPRHLEVRDVGSGAVHDAEPGRSTLIIGDHFSQRDLIALWDAGSQGVDRTGQMVVVTDTLTVAVSRPAARTGELDEDSSVPRLRVRGGVRGGVSVRLSELLLADLQRQWTPTELAAVDGHTTVATASRLLSRLRELGLIVEVGNGRGRGRPHRVAEPGRLLEWLAEVDVAPSIHHRAYLRASDPDALVDALRRRLGGCDVPVALTGAVAAVVDGAPGLSAIPAATVRVGGEGPTDVAAHLQAVAAQLGLDGSATYPNVRLVWDANGLGTVHRRYVNDIPLAPRTRVWLDLQHETRGKDAALLYREVLLGDTMIEAT